MRPKIKAIVIASADAQSNCPIVTPIPISIFGEKLIKNSI
jgi:hypothetical protein